MSLDLIAPFLTLGGIYLLTARKRSGFLVAAVGSVLWLVVGITSTYSGRPVWGLVGLSIATLLLNSWGFVRWGREG